jgi:hypothetical protein
MAFAKGSSGNPGGRPKEKAFADALRVAVNRPDEKDPEKRKKLMMLAEKLVKCALDGEGWAMQQVADRLDGKPAQAIIGGDEDDAPISVVTRIELVAADGDGKT